MSGGEAMILLTQGRVAIVDDEDFERLSRWKWHYDKGYAVRMSSALLGRRKPILMHREILNTPEEMETDHVNGDGLDNRHENLRVCIHAENQHNSQKSRANTSGYKGVSFCKSHQKWCAFIGINGKVKFLGGFIDVLDAAYAYDNAARNLFGDFARTNFSL